MTQAQPPSPFEILGLPARFNTTAAEVGAAHMRVVAQHHPDRARSAMERDDFLRRSAAAGHAKQQLMTDIGRAEALLALSGARVRDVALTPEFLAATLELREQIEEAAGDEAAMARIAQGVRGMREEVVRELAAALSDPLVNSMAACEALARLRYVERMVARLAGEPAILPDPAGQ